MRKPLFNNRIGYFSINLNLLRLPNCCYKPLESVSSGRKYQCRHIWNKMSVNVEARTGCYGDGKLSSAVVVC